MIIEIWRKCNHGKLDTPKDGVIVILRGDVLTGAEQN